MKSIYKKITALLLMLSIVSISIAANHIHHCVQCESDSCPVYHHDASIIQTPYEINDTHSDDICLLCLWQTNYHFSNLQAPILFLEIKLYYQKPEQNLFVFGSIIHTYFLNKAPPAV